MAKVIRRLRRGIGGKNAHSPISENGGFRMAEIRPEHRKAAEEELRNEYKSWRNSCGNPPMSMGSMTQTAMWWSDKANVLKAQIIADHAPDRHCEGWEAASRIVIEEITSSTGPTGGWLDSPKAVCAEIVARLLGANAREPRVYPGDAPPVTATDRGWKTEIKPACTAQQTSASDTPPVIPESREKGAERG